MHIKNKKPLFKAAAILFVLISLCIFIWNQEIVENSLLKYKAADYKSVFSVEPFNRGNNGCIIAFLTAGSTLQAYGNVEIFNVKKEAVVKKTESTKEIQQEIERYLNSITGIYVKFKPIPSSGYMVKVPLDPPVRVDNKWLKDSINESIIIFPENEEPYLMVFENGTRPLFLNFNADTKALSDKLGFKLK